MFIQKPGCFCSHSLIGICVMLASSALWGCGAAVFEPGGPWNVVESRTFDDGMDILDNPAELSNDFQDQTLTELEERMGLSDTVAIIQIHTVQTNQSSAGIEEKRLTAIVKKVLYGKVPAETLFLVSNRDSLGYELISRHEARLIGEHIAFIRWFKNTDGSFGHHFHLSPASDPLIFRATDLATKRREIEKATIRTK